MSSQPASLRVLGRGGAVENSGFMNGLASCRATAEGGAARRSGAALSVPGSGVAGFSGSCSRPALRCISRIRERTPEVTSASSSSSSKKEGSPAAVLARIAAMPSSRLSSTSRRDSGSDSSALKRARSRRASSAIAWYVARSIEVTRAFCTAPSTRRTSRARTGTMPSWSR